ncbi:type II secretion system F family protein, partial [Nocardia tengchongensis]
AERRRGELEDAAAARAERAGVLIGGPLGLCFLPAFLCLGIVPVVLGLAGRVLDGGLL